MNACAVVFWQGMLVGAVLALALAIVVTGVWLLIGQGQVRKRQQGRKS